MIVEQDCKHSHSLMQGWLLHQKILNHLCDLNIKIRIIHNSQHATLTKYYHWSCDSVSKNFAVFNLHTLSFPPWSDVKRIQIITQHHCFLYSFKLLSSNTSNNLSFFRSWQDSEALSNQCIRIGHNNIISTVLLLQSCYALYIEVLRILYTEFVC